MIIEFLSKKYLKQENNFLCNNLDFELRCKISFPFTNLSKFTINFFIIGIRVATQIHHNKDHIFQPD